MSYRPPVPSRTSVATPPAERWAIVKLWYTTELSGHVAYESIGRMYFTVEVAGRISWSRCSEVLLLTNDSTNRLAPSSEACALMTNAVGVIVSVRNDTAHGSSADTV